MEFLDSWERETKAEVTIKQVTDVSALKKIAAIEYDAWGYGEKESFPLHGIISVIETWWFVLWAYQWWTLIWFKLLMHGKWWVLFSSMTGVKTAFQSKNIWRSLMKSVYQRVEKHNKKHQEEIIKQIAWYCDPLEWKTMNLNLRKLKWIGAFFNPDVYGSWEKWNNQGETTPRIWFVLNIDDLEVKKVFEWNSKDMWDEENENQMGDGEKIISFDDRDEQSQKEIKEDAFWMETPYVFQDIKGNEKDAIKWRNFTNKTFEKYVAEGDFVLSDFFQDKENKKNYVKFVKKSMLGDRDKYLENNQEDVYKEYVKKVEKLENNIKNLRSKEYKLKLRNYGFVLLTLLVVVFWLWKWVDLNKRWRVTEERIGNILTLWEVPDSTYKKSLRVPLKEGEISGGHVTENVWKEVVSDTLIYKQISKLIQDSPVFMSFVQTANKYMLWPNIQSPEWETKMAKYLLTIKWTQWLENISKDELEQYFIQFIDDNFEELKKVNKELDPTYVLQHPWLIHWDFVTHLRKFIDSEPSTVREYEVGDQKFKSLFYSNPYSSSWLNDHYNLPYTRVYLPWDWWYALLQNIRDRDKFVAVKMKPQRTDSWSITFVLDLQCNGFSHWYRVAQYLRSHK